MHQLSPGYLLFDSCLACVASKGFVNWCTRPFSVDQRRQAFSAFYGFHANPSARICGWLLSGDVSRCVGMEDASRWVGVESITGKGCLSALIYTGRSYSSVHKSFEALQARHELALSNLSPLIYTKWSCTSVHKSFLGYGSKTWVGNFNPFEAEVQHESVALSIPLSAMVQYIRRGSPQPHIALMKTRET